MQLKNHLTRIDSLNLLKSFNHGFHLAGTASTFSQTLKNFHGMKCIKIKYLRKVFQEYFSIKIYSNTYYKSKNLRRKIKI